MTEDAVGAKEDVAPAAQPDPEAGEATEPEGEDRIESLSETAEPDAVTGSGKGSGADADEPSGPSEAETEAPQATGPWVEDSGAAASDAATRPSSEPEAAEIETTSEMSDAGIAADIDAASDRTGTRSDEAELTLGEPEPKAISAPAVPAQPAHSGFGGVALLLAGGALAALIGFLAARYLDDLAARNIEGPTPAENAEALTAQSGRLDETEAQLADLAARDIGSEISAAVDPVRSDLDAALSETSSRLDTISSDLTALTERVETLALRPVATGIDADEFDEALTEFRGQLNAAVDEANRAVADAKAEITEARATAQEISDDAFAEEQASIARAAWKQVVAALDNGTPYAEPLAEAEAAMDMPVPAIVSENAETGVPTLGTLQESFPDAARAALDVSIRSSTDGGLLDRMTAFIRVQSGARSLTPQEGHDPDAVLSRAEAAVKAGDLGTALSEIETLPEPGQAAMADWRASAETRMAATAAAAELGQELEQN